MRSSRLRDAIGIRSAAFDLLGRDGYTNGLVKDRITREIDADKDLARVAPTIMRFDLRCGWRPLIQ